MGYGKLQGRLVASARQRQGLFPVLAPLLAPVLAACCAGSASAQEFPTRPLRIIVPYAAGGFPDPMSRALAQSMGSLLGQQIVVENKPGGGGIPALNELQRAPSDGYLLLCADAQQWAFQPALRPGIYDPQKEFTPLGMLATAVLFITVRDDMPVKSFQELVALAKAKPGTLSYGSSGIGTQHHLFMETVKSQFNVDIVHIPFKGAVASIGALIAGDIPVVIAATGTLAGHLKTGKVRRLLAATSGRMRSAPDVPATADVGLRDSFPGEIGYVVAGATPRPIVERLAAVFARAAQSPEIAKAAENLYVDVTYQPPAQMAETMRADLARYVNAIKLVGLKPE